MNRQTVRDILCDWGNTQWRVERLMNRLKADELECDAAAGLKERVMDNMPHGAGITDPTQRAAQELIKVHNLFMARIEKARKQISTLLRDEWMVDCLLDELPNNFREVLTLKYRDRMTYIGVAQEMGCTDENVKKLERMAVDMLGGMIQ